MRRPYRLDAKVRVRFLVCFGCGWVNPDIVFLHASLMAGRSLERTISRHLRAGLRELVRSRRRRLGGGGDGIGLSTRFCTPPKLLSTSLDNLQQSSVDLPLTLINSSSMGAHLFAQSGARH